MPNVLPAWKHFASYLNLNFIAEKLNRPGLRLMLTKHSNASVVTR
jgi:hypothetical protein